MIKIIHKNTKTDCKFERLKCALSKRCHKNIAIYGIGVNAQRCLERFGKDRFVGLMDSKAEGMCVYGKKVLSHDEILLLGVSVIIIAATPTPTNIVYDRIVNFCITNNIEILDMYGTNLVEANRGIKLQEINYRSLTVANARELLQKKDVFVFVRNVLLSVHDDQNFILNETKNILENKGVIVSRDFINLRKSSQSKISGRQAGKLNTIYDFYTILSDIDENLSSVYADAEREAIKNNTYPRKKLLELLKEAEKRGAKIFVCVDATGSEYAVKAAMESYDIANYDIISVNNEVELQDLYRTVRGVAEEDGNENVLFIGNNRKHLLIPVCHNVDYMYIKGAEQIYSEYIAGAKYNGSLCEQERKIVYEKLDSPFLEDVDAEACLVEVSTSQHVQSERQNRTLKILPKVTVNDGLFNSLIFPKFDNVEVSIIIPVYNQFSYTYNCLKSVLMNSDGVNYEVIVADDCSTDETKDLDKFVSGINIIRNKNNLNFLMNCNNAAKYAKGKYIRL